MAFVYQNRSSYQWGVRRYQSSDGVLTTKAAELSAMLWGVPFQLFITIQIDTSLQNLKSIVNNFKQACGLYHRAPLSCAVGFEARPCVNAHLLLACSVPLDRKWIEDYFRVVCGPYPKLFNIDEYDSDRNGLPYALKSADDPDGEWDLVNLDYYINQNRRNRRYRRHQERHEMLT